ncbi:MAG: hypothetical protein ACXACA_02545 [Candidatus Ranarchaeia archaeon]
MLRSLNGTIPTILNSSSFLSQIREHQQQNGWITRYKNGSNQKSALLTTSESLDIMSEIGLLSDWDTPLHLIPTIASFPKNVTLGETEYVGVILKSDLDDPVDSAQVQVYLGTNTSLIYNSSTEIYSGFLTIPQNPDILGPNKLYVEANLAGFISGNLSIPVTITSRINLTILEAPPSIVVAPEGATILVCITLEGGGVLGITNIQLTTNPTTPYTLTDLGQGKVEIQLDLTSINGTLSVGIYGVHNYSLPDSWNTIIQVVEDGVILLGNTSLQHISVKEPVHWNFTAYTFLNASLTGEKMIWTLCSDSDVLYQKNETIDNPLTISWVSTFNETGSYTLTLSLPNKTNRRGAIIEFSFIVNKRPLDLQITHPDIAYANDTILVSGTLEDNGNPPLEIIEIECNLSNGISNYSMRIFALPSGVWTLEWLIPTDITYGHYIWTFDIINSSLYRFQFLPQTNTTVYAQVLINVEISQQATFPGEGVTITIHVTDLLFNDVEGIVYAKLQGNPTGAIGITNTPFDFTIPPGSPWGWATIDLNISSDLGGELQEQIILWIGVSSEFEVIEQPNSEIPVGESASFKLKITNPAGGFLRFYDIQYHISIEGETISSFIVESRLDGVCIIQWEPSAVGIWNLTFEFNGKDQYSPTHLSLLVNVTLIESQVSLFHYSYTETPTSNQIILEIQLTTINGNPIPNASILVNYNGTSVMRITNSEGLTSLTIEVDSLNGLLYINLIYEGNEIYAQSNGGPYPIPTRVINHPPLRITQTILPASIATSFISISLVFIRKRRKKNTVVLFRESRIHF